MESLGIIIPAAGSGQRMGTDVPKPFIRVDGTPLIVFTVRRLLQYQAVSEIVVACVASWQKRVRQLLTPHCDNKGVACHVVEGGTRRQHSVYKALQALGNTDLVAVHDAVRPFVQTDELRRCCQRASDKGAAILGIPVRDTIKVVNTDRSIRETPDRRRLWKAQTPQVFRTELLRKALKKADAKEFIGTDDASLVEWLGQTVYVVEGSQTNFKITYPEDLERATQLLKQESNND